MKLVERPEPQAARLASLSGASPEVAADAQTYAELEARVLAGGMEGIALRYGFYYGPGTWFHPDGAYADKVRRQGLRTRISRLGALDKLGLPLLYSQAGQESNAFCSIDRQDHTTSSGTSAP